MTVKLDLKNKIINGSLDFWQRNTSFAAIATSTYFADRFIYQKAGTMVHTASRSTDVPSSEIGVYSALLDVTTAQASLTASDFVNISQRIEGNVLRTFKNKKMVLTFWVKAVKTGTYCVSFRNSASNRSLVKEYSISSASTWEKKTIRFTHDSSGAWVYDTGIGMRVSFAIATGSTFRTSTVDSWQNGEFYASSNQVNGVDNLANDFLISNICLVEDNEGQTRAPDFMYAGRDYFEELQLCQRYFEKSYDIATPIATVTQVAIYDFRTASAGTNRLHVPFKTIKRTVPTVTTYNPNSGASGTWRDASSSTDRTFVSAGASIHSFPVDGIPAAINDNLQGHWTADAEL